MERNDDSAGRKTIRIVKEAFTKASNTGHVEKRS